MYQSAINYRLLVIGLATAILAACASDGGSGGADLSEPAEPQVASVDSAGVDESTLDQPVYIPGSQDDLENAAGSRVFFGYDRYDLSGEAQNILRGQAEWLLNYPSVNVVVEGHADERGTREYNLALGARRAEATKSFLTALGVSASRIRTISYGKEKPEFPGSYDSAWSKNRRSMSVVE